MSSLVVLVCLLSLTKGSCSNPILHSVLEDLLKYAEVVPESAVQRTANRAVERAALAEGLPLEDIQCLRDYDRACPEGWIDVGDASSCAAPQHYEGSCSQQISYGGLTPQEKSSQASQCGTSFPCVGSCAQDYNQLCPWDWIESSSHECFAPVAYDGPCVGRQRFTTFNNLEKTYWAQACNVVWPCSSVAHASTLDHVESKSAGGNECFVDYSVACPDGWTHEAEYCGAPTNYRGRCSLFFGASQMTRGEKEVYSDACNTPWPCISNLPN